jgi:hypothetical protein
MGYVDPIFRDKIGGLSLIVSNPLALIRFADVKYSLISLHGGYTLSKNVRPIFAKINMTIKITIAKIIIVYIKLDFYYLEKIEIILYYNLDSTLI